MKTIDKKHAERVAWAAHLVKKHPNPFLESKLKSGMFQLIDADIYAVTKVEKRKHTFNKTFKEWQKCSFKGFEYSTFTIGKWRVERFKKILARCKNATGYNDLYTAEKATKILINHFSHKRNYNLPKCLA
jgi:phosphoribosyl 1,2-cyclic phosphodiesterase